MKIDIIKSVEFLGKRLNNIQNTYSFVPLNLLHNTNQSESFLDIV